jgi:hypothetical protein
MEVFLLWIVLQSEHLVRVFCIIGCIVYVYIQFSNACGIQGIEIELWSRTKRFCLQSSPLSHMS